MIVTGTEKTPSDRNSETRVGASGADANERLTPEEEAAELNVAYVGERDQIKRDIEITRAEGNPGASLETGRVARSADNSEHGTRGGGRKRQERERRAAMDRFITMQAFQRHMDDLYDQQEFWQGEVEKFASQEEAVSKYLDALKNGDDPDFSADEQRALDEAIRLYEEKHGVTVDRNDPDVMQAVLNEANANRRDAEQNLGRVNRDIRAELEANPDLARQMEQSRAGQIASDAASIDASSTETQRQMDNAAGFTEDEAARLAEATQDPNGWFASDRTEAAADQIAPTPINAAAVTPEFARKADPAADNSTQTVALSKVPGMDPGASV